MKNPTIKTALHHAIPLLATGVGVGLSHWATSPKMKRLGDFLQQTPSSAAAYRSFRGIFSHTEACAIARQYIRSPQLPTPRGAREDHLSSCLGQTLTLEDEVSFLELSCYMRNQLLRDSDVMNYQ